MFGVGLPQHRKKTVTVDLGVAGDVFHFQQFGERGKHVGVIDQSIRHRPRRDLARPAGDEGNSMTAFFRSGLSTCERTIRPVAVLFDISRGPESAVVAGEKHERVLLHATFLECRQNPAELVIELDHVVAVGTGSALAREFLLGQPRCMRFEHGVVEKQPFRIVLSTVFFQDADHFVAKP